MNFHHLIFLVEKEILNENGQTVAPPVITQVGHLSNKTNLPQLRLFRRNSFVSNDQKTCHSISDKDFLKMSDDEFAKMCPSVSVKNDSDLFFDPKISQQIAQPVVRKMRINTQRRCKLCQDDMPRGYAKTGKRPAKTGTLCGLCERAICREKHTQYVVCTKCAV